MGLGVEGVALFERFPERRVAHDDGVKDAKFVEGELVLAQDAELLGPRDRALRRLDFAGEDFHQRGLARAVGAGDGVATPGHERAGDVLEETSGAKAHGDVVNGEQRNSIIARAARDRQPRRTRS